MKCLFRVMAGFVPALALSFGLAAPLSAATPPPAKPATPAAATPAAPNPAATRAAASDELDGVAATVNDEVILRSDVEEQLGFALQGAQTQPSPAELDSLRRRVLDKMIEEKLIVGEAKRLGITVPDADINRQVEGAIADVKKRLGGEEAYAAQLKRENLSEARLRDKYREDMRRQMLGRKLLERQFPKTKVSQTEAEAYFASHRDKFPRLPGQIRMSVIQIPPAADSAADVAGKTRAAALRKRITAGEKFAKVAEAESDDEGSARSGGDLGFFTHGSMEKSVEEAAFSLKLNEVSQPVRSAYGWHLVQPMERDTVRMANGKDSLDTQGKPVEEVHARHILIRVQPTPADVERTRQLSQRVRDEAAKGTNFATLVRRYSKYDGPANEEGDVGFVSLGSLQPNIRAGLDTLQVGEVSGLLENQAGFNIFKITDRKPEREYQLEEIKNELPDAVGQIQLQEKYEEWLKGLRAKAQIRINGS